jgi:hypothetical protein
MAISIVKIGGDLLLEIFELAGIKLVHVKVATEEQTLSNFEGSLDEPFEAELAGNEVEFGVAKFTSYEAFNEAPFKESLVVEA